MKKGVVTQLAGVASAVLAGLTVETGHYGFATYFILIAIGAFLMAARELTQND